jgi:excisionase family DNA binding protein
MNLLRGEQLADRLSISRTAAFTLIRQGKIASVRIGRLVRVTEEAVSQYILENTVNGDLAPKKIMKREIGG